METIVWITFALVVWILCSMPTKKELRRLLSANEDSKPHGWRSAVEERLGKACKITLTDPVYLINISGELTCTVLDVDDEWALVEVPDKKEGTRRVAIRLEQIKGIEEQPQS